MFLQPSHQKLDIYSILRPFVKECYLITKLFPPEEKFALVQQIRRAALSIKLRDVQENLKLKEKDFLKFERLDYRN
jgi:four helix bundle protein